MRLPETLPQALHQTLPETSESLWSRLHPSPNLPQLAGDRIVDVAVVGAGVAGLTAALHLCRAGKSVVVLDAHRVGEGASGLSTAHVTEALDTSYTKLEQAFGPRAAAMAAESTREAMNDIETFAREAGVPGAVRRLPGYLYSESPSDDVLEAELAAATRAGVQATLVRNVTRSLPLAFARTALRLDEQAALDPRAYLLGLASQVTGHGARIYERTRCVHVHERARHRVITDRGVVHATHVFYATHAPVDRCELRSRLTHRTTYVVALEVARTFPDGLFWDMAEPYHHLRREKLGDAVVVLLGGEDHDSAEGVDASSRYHRLVEYARTRIRFESIPFAWSSRIIGSVDGLPYIGVLPGCDTAYAATGFAGNGMTFGTLAGRMIADRVLGRTSPYAQLYALERGRSAAATPASGGSGRTRSTSSTSREGGRAPESQRKVPVKEDTGRRSRPPGSLLPFGGA